MGEQRRGTTLTVGCTFGELRREARGVACSTSTT
jgi:hypothetical protein